MGFALFFNIIAVILSTVASIVLIIFVVVLNEIFGFQDGVSTNCQTSGVMSDHCTCVYNDRGDNVICKLVQKKNRFDETKAFVVVVDTLLT